MTDQTATTPETVYIEARATAYDQRTANIAAAESAYDRAVAAAAADYAAEVQAANAELEAQKAGIELETSNTVQAAHAAYVQVTGHNYGEGAQ